MHGVFLDARTGEVKAKKEWSVPRPRAGIVPIGDGKFAVLAPDMIASYTRDLEQLKEFRFSADQQSHLWDFYVSPKGKSIVVNYHNPETFLQWIDTDTFHADSPVKVGAPGGSVSDDTIAWSKETYDRAQGYTFRIILRLRRDDLERVICQAIEANGQTCGLPTFLENDLLALYGPHRLRVISKDNADSHFEISIPDDEWFGRFYLSADSNKLLTTVWAHRGGNDFLDISYHNALKRIVIYDMTNGHPVYALDAKQQNLINASGFAISPNGSLLAILVNGEVQVFELPRHVAHVLGITDQQNN